MAAAVLKPIHPGVAIEDAAMRLDLEPIELALAIGITKLELIQITRGRAGIPPDLTPRLAAALGGTAEGWQKMQADYDVAHDQTH